MSTCEANGDKIPAIQLHLDQSRRSAFSECIGVVSIMNAGRRAFLIGNPRRAGVLLRSHVDRREPGSGVTEVSDHVDVLGIEPISRKIHGDIRLVGVVGGHDV